MLINQVINSAVLSMPLPVAVELVAGEWVASGSPTGIVWGINSDGTGTVYEMDESMPEIPGATATISLLFEPTAERVYTDSLAVDSDALDLEAYGLLSYRYVTLMYGYNYGGTVTGNTSQCIMSGTTGEAVTAVPETGYEFLKWSDGITTATRSDTASFKSLNVAALFYKTSDYSSIIYQYK